MKKRKTYANNGTQYAMMPYSIMQITQPENGSFSHAGAMAWDIASGTAGRRDAYYAPCDMKCVAVDKTYAFTWWQSVNKVQTVKHGLTHITIMIGHDDEINAYPGMTIKQGTQIANMGTGGNASGVHSHIEVSPTKENTWVSNSKGVYVLPNAVLPSDIFFMDDTTLVGTYKYDWKYIKDCNSKCPFKSCGTVEALYDRIRVRTTPSTLKGDTGVYYNKGMKLNYSSIVKEDGWYWAKYKRNSGGTGYVALCKTDGSSKYWKQA